MRPGARLEGAIPVTGPSSAREYLGTCRLLTPRAVRGREQNSLQIASRSDLMGAIFRPSRMPVHVKPTDNNPDAFVENINANRRRDCHTLHQDWQCQFPCPSRFLGCRSLIHTHTPTRGKDGRKSNECRQRPAEAGTRWTACPRQTYVPSMLVLVSSRGPPSSTPLLPAPQTRGIKTRDIRTPSCSPRVGYHRIDSTLCYFSTRK